MASTNTVLSIFDHHAVSVAGMETYARELSVQLGQLGWQSELVFASSPSDEVRQFLDLSNVRLHAMENCGQLAYRPMRRLASLLRTYRPKIMHLHFVPARSGYPWLAKLLGVGGIYMHDHISRLCPLCTVQCLCSRERGAGSREQGAPESPSSGSAPRSEFPARRCILRTPRWKRTVNRLFCLPVTRMFCVSSFIHDCDVAYGAMPSQRLETLYNGVDLARAESGALRAGEFRRRHAIPPDCVLVVQAGALRQEKGVPDLLHAAQRVLQDGIAVHFLLAGDGRQRQEYERLAGELGISAHVSFAGRVRDPLGEGLWAACDVACQVSRWQEAFGLTIAEAMAAGKPLVGTRTGAIPELIDDGKSGFLVEPGDTPDLAEKIATLARDPRQRELMGCCGKRICQEKFSLQKNVASLIRSYGIQ